MALRDAENNLPRLDWSQQPRETQFIISSQRPIAYQVWVVEVRVYIADDRSLECRATQTCLSAVLLGIENSSGCRDIARNAFGLRLLLVFESDTESVREQVTVTFDVFEDERRECIVDANPFLALEFIDQQVVHESVPSLQRLEFRWHRTIGVDTAMITD